MPPDKSKPRPDDAFRVTIRIPPLLLQVLRIRAEREGRTVSSLVRRIVIETVGKETQR